METAQKAATGKGGDQGPRLLKKAATGKGVDQDRRLLKKEAAGKGGGRIGSLQRNWVGRERRILFKNNDRHIL